MNCKKNLTLLAVLWILFSVLAFGGCGGGDDAATAVRAEDDYYEYVNAAWLSATEIPPDYVWVSAFTEVDDDIRETLMADLDAMASSGAGTGDPAMDMAVEFYRQCRDFDKLDADGFAPARADFERIDALEYLEDLSSEASRFIMDGLPLPFTMYIGQDSGDASKYVIFAGMVKPFLAAHEYYEEGNEAGARLMPLLEDVLIHLFEATGQDEESALSETEKALAFDALLGAKFPSAEEMNDDAFPQNPASMEELAAKSEHIDFGLLASRLVGERPRTVNITVPEFYDSFDELYNEGNFEIMKSWIKAQFLYGSARYLSRDFLLPRMWFRALANGAESIPDMSEIAYDTANEVFGDAIGIYYGKKYFGPAAREDVTAMIRDIVSVYRARLENNDWLGDATRAMAIRKLDAMEIKAGYPDKLPPVYDYYSVTQSSEGGALYGNFSATVKAGKIHNFSLYGTMFDRTLWIPRAQAHVVNAFYNPTDNSISIPAGILNAPFYSVGSSRAANMGAIGMIIGHEISHAFDSSGSKFDEIGSMKDWWTEADAAEFQRRTDAMIDLFDGLPYMDGHVNGRLTHSENTADAGGLSAALEAVETGQELSKEESVEFFESYAAIWRTMIRPEFSEQLLTEEPHSPGELRANVQLSNLDAFYETYDVVPGDGMYVAPEDRVKIW